MGSSAPGWRGLLTSLAVLLLAGGVAAGQGADVATLQGRIMDPQGEGLPGVLVILFAPGGSRQVASTLTDAEGRYALRGIAPGAGYSLKASIPEYATIVAELIDLAPGRTTVVSLTLRPASEAEETIKVEARGAIVDTATTSTASAFNAEMIEGLPLIGRKLNDVLTLAPGVDDTDGDGNPNVRGSRDTGLQLRLDGTNVNDPLSGHMGQQLNLEAIQEIEVITGGAPAEYGQTDGGFANVITKTGGNDFIGSFKLFYRSDFLDGAGANGIRAQPPRFSDTDIFFTVGGPVLKDRLWYFATVERLDEEVPLPLADNTFAIQTVRGLRVFGKLSWQVDPENRLTLQISSDPLKTGANNIGPAIDPDSDFFVGGGGPVPQLSWTAIVSPTLLFQTLVSHQEGGIDINPVSDQFRVIEVQKHVEPNGNFEAVLPCVIRNCIKEPGLSRFYHLPGRLTLTGKPGPLGESGPYNFSADQHLRRTSARSDLSWTIEEAGGQHAIKSGFEFNIENYVEHSINNPVLTDNTCEGFDCSLDFNGTPVPGARDGFMDLLVYEPLLATLKADAFRVAAYVQDSWKPIPNLTINAGLRFDHEEIDSEGFTDFDPRPEAREALRRFDLLCDAAGTVCTLSRTPGRRDGHLPGTVYPPPGHPALKFDLNGDGGIDTTGAEGAQFTAPFTRPADRAPESIFMPNNNVSPRFSLSWDPWADGKTKVFGNWGLYYDRLFLSTVTTEQQPQSYTATWQLSLNGAQAEPGSLSQVVTAPTIPQTDRHLRTPYTIEWTAGFERELAPEWAVSLTWIERRAIGLLQNVDINHVTCKGFNETFRVDPMDVCGDAGFLELDRFGRLAPGQGFPARGTVNVPNGAPDLYNLDPYFNQVLRLGNFNGSRYTATELTLRKRLRRNWQMLMSYTYSKALGDAESFTSQVGNDPAVSDKQSGYLDYDQRHVLKWEAVTHLPHDLLLGGTVRWASGLPYSFVRNVEDVDDAGNVTPQRIFSISGTRNDQRNNPQLTVDGHIEKRLAVGKTYLTAFLDAENLFNNDELTLKTVDIDSRSALDGGRRFGRRWQIGLAVLF